MEVRCQLQDPAALIPTNNNNNNINNRSAYWVGLDIVEKRRASRHCQNFNSHLMIMMIMGAQIPGVLSSGRQNAA